MEENLMSLGLSRAEAKIYLGLLQLGEARTGILCDKLKITNSHVYRYLQILIEKGLVSYKIKNNVKVFMASDPESLTQLFAKEKKELENKEKNLKKAIKELKSQPKHKETISDYKYFEGISGIKSMWTEMNDLLKPNSIARYYTGTTKSWKTLNAFYLDHHKKRAKKKVKMQMILPKGAKKEAKQRKKIGYFEHKLIDIKNDGEFGVYDDFIIIQYTNTKTPRGFLIKDQIFVSTFKEIFDKLWKA